MKTAGLFKAPEVVGIHGRRRRRGDGKLTLIVGKRDSRGFALSARVADGIPYWRCVYRVPKSEGGWSNTFYARDWDDAKQEVGRLRAEHERPEPSASPDPLASPSTSTGWRWSEGVSRYIAAARARGRARDYTIDGYGLPFEPIRETHGRS
jgi:hypothetical protein